MNLTDDDKKWITEQLAALADKHREDLERVETKLLTAFQQWASPLEMRMRTHTAALRALDAEVEYHEDRLKKLEHPDQNAAA